MKKNSRILLRLAITLGALALLLTASASWTLNHTPLAASELTATQSNPVGQKQGIQPIIGTGSGGAVGPRVIESLQAMPDATALTRTLTGPTPEPPEPRGLLGAAGFGNTQSAQVVSSNAVENGSASDIEFASSNNAGSQSTFPTFTSYSTLDVNGASDGHFIVSNAGNGDFVVYNLSGSIIKELSQITFLCGGSNALPICSTGGFGADGRVLYDTTSGRWIFTALWLFSTSPVAMDVLAVSQSGDPTAGWNLYQFPACGAFDTWDLSDQPHTGFNSRWIVVTSACSASMGVDGAGLAVFDKNALYSGNGLALNQNWFEFVDPYSPYSLKNNPATTYVPTVNDREYLTVSMFDDPYASVIYSYIEGPADAPAYFAGVNKVTPSFVATFPPSVDSPGCTGCLGSFAFGWIHSSGVWAFHTGAPYVVSTMVWGDPRFVNSTQIISIATNTITGAAEAMQLASGRNGAGALASEIAMPLRSSGPDQALIVYDFSASDFYPGVKSAIWNLDTNRLQSISVIQQGSFTPTSAFDVNRWTDFIDALTPIPDSAAFVFGATLASPSANDPERSTLWGMVGLRGRSGSHH